MTNFLINSTTNSNVFLNYDPSADKTKSPLANSDKCCGGTRDTTHGDFCYILRQPITQNGLGLAIETHYTEGGKTTKKGSTIILSVPFRMMLADIDFIKNLSFKDQPKNAGALEWNPGLSVGSDNKITTSITSPTSYYELNLTKSQLSKLVNKSVKLYDDPNACPYYLHASQVEAHILEPKMMVDHNAATDTITIIYNARVDLKGMTYNRKHNGDKVIRRGEHLFWTVPYVLQFDVTKATLKLGGDYRVNQFGWSYAIDSGYQYGITSLNSLGGTFATTNYDYGVIPHYSTRVKLSFPNEVISTSQSLPFTCGCKFDLYSDRDRTQTIVACSLGYYNSSAKRFKYDAYVSRLDLSSNGFNAPTETQKIPVANHIDNINPVTKLSVAVNSTTMAVAVSRENAQSNYASSFSTIRLYSLVGGFTSDGYYSIFNNVPYVILSPYLSEFLLTCVVDKISKGKSLTYPTSITANGTYNIDNQTPSFCEELWSVAVSDVNPVTSEYKIYDLIRYFDLRKNIELQTLATDCIGNYYGIIPRVLASGVVNIDFPKWSWNVRSITYDMPIDPTRSPGGPESNLYTTYDDNEANSEDYFYITHEDFCNFITTKKVTSIKTYPLDISNCTVQVNYWNYPQDEASGSDGNNEGVKCIITLQNCSGLFTSGTISGGLSWDPSARPASVGDGERIHGGIPLDPDRTRDDIDYRYYGTEESYQNQQPPSGTNSLGENRFGGGYSVRIENYSEAQLNYNGINILADIDDNDIYKFWPECWRYCESGIFHMNIHTNLNLNGITGEDGVSTYVDDSFQMSGCLLTVKVKNKYGDTLSKLENQSIDFVPPAASGYITTNVGYKVLNGINYNLHRVVNPASDYFTTVRNVKFNYYDYSKSENNSYNNDPAHFWQTSNDGATEDVTLTFDNDITLDRGDYVYVTYEPRLKDSRGVSGTTRSSEKVSCVKYHKFHINEVAIEFNGDSGWTDVTSQIATGSLIFYETVSDLDIRVTFSVDHETWPGRSELSDHQIYPYIKRMFTFITQGMASPSPNFIHPYEHSAIQYKTLVPLAGVAETYPNHTEAFGTLIKNKFLNISGNYPTMISGILPGDTTLTSFAASTHTFNMTISEPGEYQIYLIIEDEFDQRSCFCLTNIAGNYNIPFRSS